jgi:hypothetical protein
MEQSRQSLTIKFLVEGQMTQVYVTDKVNEQGTQELGGLL